MNNILDYEQVVEKLKTLSINPDFMIKTHKPIGYSTFGLPILHYSIGFGKKHIVISGATHGSEIITTDFVLKLMEKTSGYDFIKENKYTIHFFPMLNPEGYLISTSAVRQLIPREMSDIDSQKIIKEYIEKYNLDTNSSLGKHVKRYQKMFEDIDYRCIPDKYVELKNNIKELYNRFDIPKGTLQVWSSNGNGIDLNQNSPYNEKISLLDNDIDIFGPTRYSNIKYTCPGPIGCPSKISDFKFEPETNSFRDFMISLKHNREIDLCAYFNYHSAENTIYYELSKSHDIFNSTEKLFDIPLYTEYNRAIAELYSNITEYDLIGSSNNINCFNDLLRLEIPGDILIELAPNEGNPLSAYEDVVYSKTINDNLLAVYNVLLELPELFKAIFKDRSII